MFSIEPAAQHFTCIKYTDAMQHNKKNGIYPVRLPDTPITQGPVPLSHALINTRVCEFVEVYEEHLRRTLIKGTGLVKRWVLDTEHLFAALIPICPSRENAHDLPTDEIDCVACVLETPSSFWARGCYVLRVRAIPNQISFELYVGAVPTAPGAIPMQFRSMWHALSTWGTSPENQRARERGTPLEQAMEQAQVRSERYQTFVMKALEAALTTPPQVTNDSSDSSGHAQEQGVSSPAETQSSAGAPRRRRD